VAISYRLVGVIFAVSILQGCKEPTADEKAFQEKFDREAILVKTCGYDPGVASGGTMKVYRFQNELWFNERYMQWRRVDGKVDNVCDLLDIDAGHKPPPPPSLLGPLKLNP